MRKSVWIMVCAVLCVVMTTSLFSCEIKGNEEETTTTENETFALTAENLSEYRIIVSERISKELSDATSFLRGYIKSITGTEPEIKTDFVVEGSDIYKTQIGARNCE